jgi:hypothetical protein
MLNNDEIVALCRNELDQAYGYDADQLATVRQKALDYYHGRMHAAAEGRSQFVSHDVADVVHNLLGQVSRQFSGSTLMWVPDSEDDEPQAQLESDYVRAVLEKNNGYQILSQSAHEALLSGNGWIKCEVEEETEVTVANFGQLEPLQLQAVSQPASPGGKVDVTETETGYRIRKEKINKRLNIEALPADIMIYSTESGVSNINDLRMVGERKMLTSSELKALGLSDDDIGSIPEIEDDYWPAVHAREGEYQHQTDLPATQDAEKPRECFDLYMRIDMEENGTSELWRVLFGGSVLIEKEPAECVPYATGSPCPVPFRVAGQGMYQLMRQIQDAKTHTWRNYLDNLSVANNSRVVVVESQVNMKDVVNGRINGVIRAKREGAVTPMPASDIGAQSVQGLQALDMVRSDRGGQAVAINEADRQLMASSATAATGAIESSERMAGWYCHNMVHSLLADTYRLIHKKMRTKMKGETEAKLRGKWQKTDPASWKDRQHLEITLGLTSSERTHKINGLAQLISNQVSMMQQGGEGIITDKAKTYSAMADWIRASELGQPEEYLIDPEGEQATQYQQQAQQAQQQQQQKQDALMQKQIELEEAKIIQDKYKVDEELKFKYYEAGLDAEIQEAKITTDTITKLETTNNADKRASA